MQCNELHVVINTTIILIFGDDFTNIKLSTFKELVGKLRTFNALKIGNVNYDY